MTTHNNALHPLENYVADFISRKIEECLIAAYGCTTSQIETKGAALSFEAIQEVAAQLKQTPRLPDAARMNQRTADALKRLAETVEEGDLGGFPPLAGVWIKIRDWYPDGLIAFGRELPSGGFDVDHYVLPGGRVFRPKKR